MSEMPVPVSQIPEALVLDETVFAPGVTDAKLWIPKTELIEGLLDAAFAADLGFHRVEHAFYRMHVQETITSAHEFGHRCEFISARNDNNICVRHDRG